MGITFDGPTKLITLTSGTTSVSVRELWSRWVDWLMLSDNSKYFFAFQSVGGDEITEEISVPIYAFLVNGWRIKPQEANHTLNVGDGILVVAGGGDPFINTTGSYVVRINYQQPVQAITVATGGSTGPSVEEIVDGVWTSEQGERLTELPKRFALDSDVPVIHSETGIVAGDIEIEITENEDGTFTEQRTT